MGSGQSGADAHASKAAGLGDLLTQNVTDNSRHRRHGNGNQGKIQNNFLSFPGVGEPPGGKILQLAGVSDIHEYVSVSKLALASVDMGTHGFPGPKRRPAVLSSPACLVCLASLRLCSGKTRRPVGRSGASMARQRTQACRRKSRTITQPAACRNVRRECVPLSADAMIVINEIRKNSK